jgi:hypothetical protein
VPSIACAHVAAYRSNTLTDREAWCVKHILTASFGSSVFAEQHGTFGGSIGRTRMKKKKAYKNHRVELVLANEYQLVSSPFHYHPSFQTPIYLHHEARYQGHDPHHGCRPGDDCSCTCANLISLRKDTSINNVIQHVPVAKQKTGSIIRPSVSDEYILFTRQHQ